MKLLTGLVPTLAVRLAAGLSLVATVAWPARAQVRAAGPWRVSYRWERVRRNDSWNLDWAAVAPADPGARGRPAPDTTTVRQRRRQVLPVAWNVDPATVTLLRNCENPLLAPPTGAGVRFAATGATLRLERATRHLLLLPTGPTVVLRAYRGGRPLFVHTFRVQAAPAPVVTCLLSTVADEGIIFERVPPANWATLWMMARPIQDFAVIMPDDARYRVARTHLALQRAGRTLRDTALTCNGIYLAAWYARSLPGDSLRVTVRSAQRLNAQGVIDSVAVSKSFRRLFRR